MTDKIVRWCAIADEAHKRDETRFQILDDELNSAGLKTDFKFLTADEKSLPEILEQAKGEFSQIRFTGEVGRWTLPFLDRLPSALKSLKSADALVCEDGHWWPRFFLVSGLNQMFSSDAINLDIRASVFILGATMEARAVVGALSQIGFGTMIIGDPDDEAGSAFVEDLKRSYFGVQFQSVARNMITQLPGICSMAVNTMNAGNDNGIFSELAYFNFLKAGGYWLDLSIFPVNSILKTEAQSVGAALLSGARSFALTDRDWAKAAFRLSINTGSYVNRLDSF